MGTTIGVIMVDTCGAHIGLLKFLEQAQTSLTHWRQKKEYIGDYYRAVMVDTYGYYRSFHNGSHWPT